MTRYTFGASEAAAQRLEKIAGFFDPFSEELISWHVTSAVDCVLDLGCGPGFTTAMLARALPNARICGLDKSDAFLRMARRRFPRCDFVAHDITVTPFPRRAKVMYARFLLSHLPAPVELMNRWAAELKDGWLIVEELDGIETGVDVFRRYLAANAALIAAQGADLFVGRALGQGTYSAKVLCNQTVRLPVPNAQAASWFLPNTQTIWETDPFVRERLSADERADIRDRLAHIQQSQDTRSDITWHMRRVVLRA